MKLNLKAIIIAVGVVTAMAVEGVVFLLLMPSQPKSAAGDAQTTEKTAEKEEEAAVSDTAEEPIGDPFNCTNNQQESNLHLRFKVVAVVKANQSVAFRDMNTAHKTRVRQAIEKIVRRAQREDLNDPNLSTLTRLMREEINKVLGKSYVIDAVIHDFSMIEQ